MKTPAQKLDQAKSRATTLARMFGEQYAVVQWSDGLKVVRAVNIGARAVVFLTDAPGVLEAK